MDFLQFLEANKDRLLETVSRALMRQPPTWNLPDNRYNISNYMCHILSRDFPELKMLFAQQYDLIYVPKDFPLYQETISVKIGSQLIPAKTKNTKSGFRKPGRYILKNTNSEAAGKELQFDWLFGIQKEEHDQQKNQLLVWPTTLAVIRYQSFKDDVQAMNNGAQLGVRIEDISRYDWLVQKTHLDFEAQRKKLGAASDEIAIRLTAAMYDKICGLEVEGVVVRE